MTMLRSEMELVDRAVALELSGSVLEVRGMAVYVADLPVPVGASVIIKTQGGSGSSLEGEVVGFNDQATIVMPWGATTGIVRGDRVVGQQIAQSLSVGPGLLGRVLNARGTPIDNRGPLFGMVERPINPAPIDPMDRAMIDTPLATGVRAVDGLVSIGRGQRLGVFAEPGVGKSVLLGMMASSTAADVSVIALVGERGREVGDFIRHHLGEPGMARSVVVCATGDEPALLRLRAAMAATTIAEYFRDEGRDVLLIMDSITRFCQAQRQIGLAAGEPPATKGYPPSVFAMLPKLLERSGRTHRGSITGLYAVLVEGDPDVSGSDPIGDAVRGVLDGHLMLNRQLANRGHWPAIDVVASISRASNEVADGPHREARQEVLRSVAAYREVEELVNIGAYAAGGNLEFDLAIACRPMIDRFVQQGRSDVRSGDFDRTRQQLLTLAQQMRGTKRQLARSGGARRQDPVVPGGAQGPPGWPGEPQGPA